MKTPTQIINKLEELSGKFETFTNGIPEEQRGENIPHDRQVEVAYLMGTLFALGWICDCEEQLKSIFVLAKIANSTETLFGKTEESR